YRDWLPVSEVHIRRLARSFRGAMVFGLRGQPHALPFRKRHCLLMGHINRTLERQRVFVKHSAEHPISVALRPEKRHWRALPDKVEIFTVRHFVSPDGERGNVYGMRAKFVVPSELSPRIESELRLAFGDLDHLPG